MANIETVQDWVGRTLVDQQGDKIGTIEDIYLDTDTDQPEWATVRTGVFGRRVSFVPVEGAGTDGDAVRVAYTKQQVTDSPNVEPDGQLTEDEEARLYRHYGREYATAGAGYDAVDTTTRDAGVDTAGGAMTRSEEELRVGTQAREVGRARLRKHIVTEPVSTTVQVQREEARVVREPVTDANVDAALTGADLSEEEHEVVLRAEEPVVEKRVVPKERVRLDTETVTEEREVTEEVRKERIDVDDDDVRRH